LSSREEEKEEKEFAFVHSPPQISRMIWPCRGMMLMEGEVVKPGTQCTYNIKLLLSLEATSNVDGWMWFEQAYNKPKFIARVFSGTWNSNGHLSFHVHCSPQGALPNSHLNPSNLTSLFEIDGKFEHCESSSLAVFTANVTKKESDITIQKDELPLMPLDDLTSIECHNIRAMSGWHLLLPCELQELPKPKSKLDL